MFVWDGEDFGNLSAVRDAIQLKVEDLCDDITADLIEDEATGDIYQFDISVTMRKLSPEEKREAMGE